MITQINTFISELFAWANFAVYGLAGIIQLVVIIKCKREGWWYIKLGFGILNIYWSGLYLFVALTEPGQYMSSVLFGQLFIRPAFLWMGFMSLFAGIYSLRSKCQVRK